MKKVLVWVLAAVFCLGLSSVLRAQNSFTTYGTMARFVAAHEFSDTAVTFRFTDNQNMTQLWLHETKHDTLKEAKSYTTKPSEVTGVALGFDFTFGEMTAKYVGFTGGGCLYFGAQANMQAVWNPMFYESGNNRHIYNYLYMQFSALNPYDDYEGVTLTYNDVKVYGSDSTTVKYETDDNVLYVEYANLHIADVTGNNILVFSFQYKIEAEGTVSMIPLSMRPLSRPEKSVQNYQTIKTHTYGIGFGLVGDEANGNAIYMGDFEGNRAVSDRADVYTRNMRILWDADHYPAHALVFGLFNSCEAIVEPEVMRWEYSYGSQNFYVQASSGLNWKEGEKALLVLSQKRALTGTDLPASGTEYHYGSSVGSSAGVLVGSKTGSTGRYTSYFSDHENEIIGLKPNTKYYLHVFPYNVTCANGPVYNTGKIPVDSFSTYPAAPSSLDVQMNGSTATLTVGHTLPYLLAVSRKQLPSGGRIALHGSYEKGATLTYVRHMDNMDGAGSDRSDTMHFALKILEADATANTVTMEGLEDGADYYFYAWTNADNGRVYSNVATEAAVAMPRKITGDGTVVDFSSMTHSPMGWSFPADNTYDYDFHEHLFRENGNGRWLDELNYISVQATAGVSRAVSPMLDKGDLNEVSATFDLFYWSRSALTGDISAATPSNSDSLIVEYKGEDETVWHLLAAATKESGFDAATGTLKLETEAFAPASARFRMRLTVKSNYTPTAQSGTPYASLRGFKVEPSLPCKPVSGLTTDGAGMLHNEALLKWNENNVTGSASFRLRWREASAEQWAGTLGVKGGGENLSQTVGGLKPLTSYVAEVTAVCGAGDTSLSRTTAFTTIGILPYKLSDRNFGEITQKTGTLPATGVAVLSTIPSDREGWGLDMDGGISIRDMKSENNPSSLWMLLPALSAENHRGSLALTLHLRAWSQNANGEEGEPAFGTGDKCFVLVSADGNFRAADITDTVDLSRISRQGKDFVFHPAVSSPQLNIALYTTFNLPSGENTSARFNTLTLDSLTAEWGDIICDPVKGISQSNLTKTTVDLKWRGESLEYAVAYQIRDTETWDTAYTDTTFCRLTGLVAGEAYRYKIWGYCAPGRTNPSEASAMQYFNTVPPCQTPVMTLVETTENSITVALEQERKLRLVEMWVMGHEGDSNYYHAPILTYESTVLISDIDFNGAKDFILRCRNICGAGDTSDYSKAVEAHLSGSSVAREKGDVAHVLAGVKLAPNPVAACQEFKLVLPDEACTVEIFNAAGALVRCDLAACGVRHYSLSTPGLYLIRVSAGAGSAQTTLRIIVK